jgi:hypothetical protein
MSLHRLQGAGSSLGTINSIAANMVKVQSLGGSRLMRDAWSRGAAKVHPPAPDSRGAHSYAWSAARCDVAAWKVVRPDVSAWKATTQLHSRSWPSVGINSWTPTKSGWIEKAKRVERPGLRQSQRDWLARGIRSWAYEAEAKGARETSSPNPRAREMYSDLGHFLVRRGFESNQKRIRWVGADRRMGTLWDWFDYFHRTALPRLVSSLDPTALSRELLAVLAPPPGWTKATRFRVVLEALIPGTLEQLAEVIRPNAPSRRARHLLRGGTAV